MEILGYVVLALGLLAVTWGWLVNRALKRVAKRLRDKS